jgi:protein involved in polysaccharide export with SLBB domain
MNKHFIHLLAAIALLAAAGCASKAGRYSQLPANLSGTSTNFTATKAADSPAAALLHAESKPFVLGPGDSLEIEVLGNAASRALTMVGLDGKIYYQILPGLDVWGLTLAQTRDVIERELGKYLNNPQVTVTLRTVGSKYVWLLGRLTHPGVYPITGPMTLLESFAVAGGTYNAGTVSTEDLADLRHSFVMRQGQLLPVDFYRLFRDGDMSQNIQLQPDDFVYVPSALAQQVYVLGAVRMPRAVVYDETMTLVSAIAQANGFVKYDYLQSYYQGRTPDAYLSHVAIVRGSLAEPKVGVFDFSAIVKGKAPDVRLQPGDIIYVPNSPYRTIKAYANMILNAFVTTVAANEGVRAGGGNSSLGVSVPVGGR